MDDSTDWPAAQFQAHRAYLRSVAYRMLGSLSEADDAVQDAWLRLLRSGRGDVLNPRAWLTTVVSRVCLDMLRSRAAQRAEPLDAHLPDPVVSSPDDDPERHAELADSIGLALLIVLDTLSPAERLAFVLHDIFAVPFEQVGSILDRSPAAAKQLASRARRRLRDVPSPDSGDAVPGAAVPGAAAAGDAIPGTAVPSAAVRQRGIAEAFLAASRQGNFGRLLALLDPDVVLRADAGSSPLGRSQVVHGAPGVARQAHRFAAMARHARPVLINGAPGFLVARDGQPLALIGLTVRRDLITELNILADPERLRRLDLGGLLSPGPP